MMEVQVVKLQVKMFEELPDQLGIIVVGIEIAVLQPFTEPWVETGTERSYQAGPRRWLTSKRGDRAYADIHIPVAFNQRP